MSKTVLILVTLSLVVGLLATPHPAQAQDFTLPQCANIFQVTPVFNDQGEVKYEPGIKYQVVVVDAVIDSTIRTFQDLGQYANWVVEDTRGTRMSFSAAATNWRIDLTAGCAPGYEKYFAASYPRKTILPEPAIVATPVVVQQVAYKSSVTEAAAAKLPLGQPAVTAICVGFLALLVMCVISFVRYAKSQVAKQQAQPTPVQPTATPLRGTVMTPQEETLYMVLLRFAAGSDFLTVDSLVSRKFVDTEQTAKEVIRNLAQKGIIDQLGRLVPNWETVFFTSLQPQP